MQPSYPDFRKRLDAVLRQRDPAALRAFLVESGQWDAETTTDPERAMWMMIATSPALATMHGDAIAWLSQHGYAEEAQALGSHHETSRHTPSHSTGLPARGARRTRPRQRPQHGSRRPPHRRDQPPSQ